MSASILEEDACITPWVGPSSYKKYLSVLLLSSDLEILERLNSALIEMHTKGDYAWNLQTTRCHSLSDVTKEVRITGNVAIDFIVMALDTSKVFCLEWAKIKLKEVHPDLLRRRVVLVNTSHLPIYSMAIESDSILKLQQEMDLDLFNGNIYNYEDAMFLAKRLLTYLEMIVGVKTGIPNLHI